MRVIAGSAKRLLLKTIEGKDTRPTTDRIKETLFNMMQNDVYGCTFLDLFSGSGAIGIEALSRGAEMAVMVEHNPRAAQCIRENLKITHLEDKATVMNCDVITALKRLEERQLVFLSLALSLYAKKSTRPTSTYSLPKEKSKDEDSYLSGQL